MTRRRFLATLGAGGAALGLAACGSPPKSSSSKLTNGASADVPSWILEKAKPYKGRTLDVVGFQQYFPQTDTDFSTACSAFAQATGTTINVSFVNPDSGAVVAKADAAEKSGNVQDLMFVQGSEFVPQFEQLGDIIPVTDVVNELEQHYGATPDCNKYYMNIKNEWWGIPFFSLANGWFARKDWLDAKGIKQSEFSTWEQGRDVALEISDPSQQRYGWGATVNDSGDADGMIVSCLNAYGASICSNDGTKVVFNSSEAEEAVTFLAGIYTDSKYAKMLPPGVDSWTDTSNNEAWLAGITGFTANQYSLYAQSRAENNPVYHKTLTFPGFAGPATNKKVINIGDSESFIIFKHAKQPELAKLLAEYLVYGAPLLRMVKDSVGQVLPAYANIWHSNSFYLKGDQAFKGQYETLTETLPIKTTSGLTFPQAASPAEQAVESGYILCDMMGQIISKKATVKEAISAANQRMIQIFEQQGYPQS